MTEPKIRRLTLEEAAARLEETRKIAGDDETRACLDRAIADVKRIGRKPKAPEKRRDASFTVRFNREELARVEAALEGRDVEFSAGLRELALLGADALTNAKNDD